MLINLGFFIGGVCAAEVPMVKFAVKSLIETVKSKFKKKDDDK